MVGLGLARPLDALPRLVLHPSVEDLLCSGLVLYRAEVWLELVVRGNADKLVACSLCLEALSLVAVGEQCPCHLRRPQL